MAVTTRNKVGKTTDKGKKPASAPKKSAPKRTTSTEPESEEDEDEDEGEDDIGQDNDNERDSDYSDGQDDSSDEDTFKIHTPKAPVEPRIAPSALPTIKYDDESDDDDSDAAPEAESLSSAKAKAVGAQDKEKSFLSKVQAEQKAKRVEREEKLKEQKAKKEAKQKTQVAKVPTPKVNEVVAEGKESPDSTITRSGLPTMLPMDLLESVAKLDESSISSGSSTNDKKRKHMRPEDFALMELEAELRAETLKRKKAEKTQKNVGPVTVKVLDKSHLAKGHAIPETVVDFRKQHFYGSKIQRKDAILNQSQRNLGAASKFNRRK
ncbi:hypothetical protein BGZ76_011387 [Entomortierella beljakovae]|nr:hypothetical protein BGZ76_011387 [Entomortierella beljakovae]